MRRLAWLSVVVVLVVLVGACGDSGEFVASPGPTKAAGVTTTVAPVSVPIGEVDEWCEVLAGLDPTLPLFVGAAVLTGGAPDDVRASTEAVVAAYEALSDASPSEIADDLFVVRAGYQAFRDDLAVVDYEYERVFEGIGQRPWQEAAFTEANSRLAAFANEQCGAGVVAQPSPAPSEFDDVTRQFLIDALVDTGLTQEQAACLADALGPDLGAASGQPMAFEDAMAGCDITFEDFVPDG